MSEVNVERCSFRGTVQHEDGVSTARQSEGTANGIYRIVGFHFSRVMQNQHRNGPVIGKAMQRRQAFIIFGIPVGGFDRTDAGKRVKNYG